MEQELEDRIKELRGVLDILRSYNEISQEDHFKISSIIIAEIVNIKIKLKY